MPLIYVNARFLTQQTTGVQRYAIEITKELIKINPDVRLVAPRNILHQELAKELNVGIIGRLKGHLWEQIDLPLYLRSIKNPLLLNLGNTGPVRYHNQIVTIHDLSFLVNPDWFSTRFAYFYSLLIPRLATSAKAISTVSAFSKQEMVRILGTAEQKIQVIPGAISSTLTGASPSPDPLPFSVPGKYILAVGSIDPRKNLRALIEAFQQRRDKAVHLVVVGSRNKVFADDQVRQNAEADATIHFTGYVSDAQLVQLYRNATLFVYPSLYEGFGLPPLEALYQGCPVIVSDIPPHREVCGEAAVYVDPGSVPSILAGIEEVSGNAVLKSRMIAEGQQRVRCFSWVASAGKLNALIGAIQASHRNK
jgi:glycosyltransferase involved in cell wall biosynthesis